jgi:hypothetical protein
VLPVHCSMQKGLTSQGGSVVEVQGEAKAAQHNICRRHVLLKAQPEHEKIQYWWEKHNQNEKNSCLLFFTAVQPCTMCLPTATVDTVTGRKSAVSKWSILHRDSPFFKSLWFI